jgi:hypothetical protein
MTAGHSGQPSKPTLASNAIVPSVSALLCVCSSVCLSVSLGTCCTSLRVLKPSSVSMCFLNDRTVRYSSCMLNAVMLSSTAVNVSSGSVGILDVSRLPFCWASPSFSVSPFRIANTLSTMTASMPSLTCRYTNNIVSTLFQVNNEPGESLPEPSQGHCSLCRSSHTAGRSP